MLQTRKEIIFFILSGVFITSAIVAELISGKLVHTPLFPVIAGLLPWPIVFLITDTLNEFYGKTAVKRLSWICMGLIGFAFLILILAVQLPTEKGSYLAHSEFQKVFGGALPIILGSITAFIVSQLLDVYLFGFFKKLTNGKYIWLRATGSTAISQLFDSYIVLIIGFWIPGNYTLGEVAILGITGYSMKLILAVLLTPFIYALHGIIRKLLMQENKITS